MATGRPMSRPRGPGQAERVPVPWCLQLQEGPAESADSKQRARVTCGEACSPRIRQTLLAVGGGSLALLGFRGPFLDR